MKEPLYEDEKSELERRRMAEAVSKSVEEALKRRYTWLAIVVSFLFGGGAVLAMNQVTKPAERMLTRHEILLSQAEKSLDDVAKLTDTARQRLDGFGKTIDGYKKEMIGVSEGKQSLNQRLIETLEEVKRIAQSVDSLKESVRLLSQGRKVSIQPLKNTTQSVSNTLYKTRLSQYTIFVHYKNEKDMPVISEIADHLRNLGYSVPKIRQVDYKVNDIRYYHDKDIDAANSLQNDVIKYLKSKTLVSVDLSPKYFGDRYPNVREGVIELWLNFL
jgi:hypothetical protein